MKKKWREHNNLIENIFQNRSMIIQNENGQTNHTWLSEQVEEEEEGLLPSNNKIIILTNPLSLIVVLTPNTQYPMLDQSLIQDMDNNLCFNAIDSID